MESIGRLANTIRIDADTPHRIKYLPLGQGGYRKSYPPCPKNHSSRLFALSATAAQQFRVAFETAMAFPTFFVALNAGEFLVFEG